LKDGCFIVASTPTKIGVSKAAHYTTHPSPKANTKLQ